MPPVVGTPATSMLSFQGNRYAVQRPACFSLDAALISRGGVSLGQFSRDGNERVEDLILFGDASQIKIGGGNGGDCSGLKGACQSSYAECNDICRNK